MTTKEHILLYLRQSGKTSGSQLEKQADEWGTKPSVISRRCRELVNEGKLWRTLSERKTVYYSLPMRAVFEPNLQKIEQEEQVGLF